MRAKEVWQTLKADHAFFVFSYFEVSRAYVSATLQMARVRIRTAVLNRCQKNKKGIDGKKLVCYISGAMEEVFFFCFKFGEAEKSSTGKHRN